MCAIAWLVCPYTHLPRRFSANPVTDRCYLATPCTACNRRKRHRDTVFDRSGNRMVEDTLYRCCEMSCFKQVVETIARAKMRNHGIMPKDKILPLRLLRRSTLVPTNLHIICANQLERHQVCPRSAYKSVNTAFVCSLRT